MRQVLDSEAITRRRYELGLSERRLAAATGTSAATIDRLEDGTNHHELRVGFLLRLADALGWRVTDLLAAESGETEREAPTVDDARLEALLHRVGRGVTRTCICHAFGWDRGRLAVAEDALAKRLRGTGVRLHRHTLLSVQPKRLLITDDEFRRLLGPLPGRALTG